MPYTTSNIDAVMLAGGQGSRLHELTVDTCKPAVHFAGRRRIVDWIMDNLVRAKPQKVWSPPSIAPPLSSST